MSGCLSEDALTRVEADLATAAERAHLASCAACTGRARRARRQLEVITAVLRDSPVPLPLTRPAPPRRRWVPAIVGLSVSALALLLWVEVAVWRAVTPVPPSMQPQEVAAILSDVSASLFSVTGDPAALASTATAEDGHLTLEAMAQELDRNLTGEAP